MRVPQEVQFAVAEMFWAYMKKVKQMPETRTMLGKLYNDTFRTTLLSNPIERRVNFSSVLFSLRKIGVVKWPRKKDKETIVYNSKGRRTSARKNLAYKINEVNTAITNVAQLVLELREKLVKHRTHLAQDKGDISILPESDKNGVIDLGIPDVGELKEVELTVINQSNRRHSFGCVVLGTTTDFNVDYVGYDFMGKEISSQVELAGNSRSPITIPVTINEHNPGVFHVVVAFWFRCGTGDPFHIVKFVKVDFRNDVVNELQPTVPYEKPEPLRFDPNVDCIKGEKLPMQSVDYKVTLKPYPVPKKLRHEWKSDSLDISLPTFIHGSTAEEQHCKRLSVLLHVEELQMEEDIQRYNIAEAKLNPVSKGCLALTVPGLAENRPSLIRGDRLFVRKVKADGTRKDKEYEGFVHRVERDEVHLKFNPVFHREFVKNLSLAVRFSFRRTPLRLMHRALEQAPSYLEIIPFIMNSPTGPEIVPGDRLCFYNRKIEDNEEQKQAVQNIVAGMSRPYPYLVFGPPGTGKTVTMVEAINQVLKLFPQSKILACAPSNSAADLLLERVAQQKVVPKDKMVRLNAFGRSKNAVNPKVMEFCIIEGDFFCFPKREDIMKYRLVVTTLISAGRLVSLGIDNSHFTHLFIDEAGQGMEPECLVAIAGLFMANDNRNRQLVLAGDPKQLGPVLRSRLAKNNGLGVSFLERLLGRKFPCYNRHPGSEPGESGAYDAKMVTKLLNNYRSHPDIIKVPNEMFYDDELRACADVMLRQSFCQWEGLPNKGFPVIFKGVNGKDEREKKSPSFFNPQEVDAVLGYVQSLKETKAGGMSIKADDIGIISPYHQQVLKIREKIRSRHNDLRDIKVGSVEEFQGQERKVIIISTVRSSEEFLYYDANHKLGFLGNPKRFNVAVTRAKALLIVIGNPHVLCRDHYWLRFIGFCQENGSYVGCAFEMPDIDDDHLATQMKRLGLDSDQVLRRYAIDDEDPEWRPPRD